MRTHGLPLLRLVPCTLSSLSISGVYMGENDISEGFLFAVPRCIGAVHELSEGEPKQPRLFSRRPCMAAVLRGCVLLTPLLLTRIEERLSMLWRTSCCDC